ncbi:MAG: hypothetical protein NVSMB47_14030 [Polyangiales bacterium]
MVTLRLLDEMSRFALRYTCDDCVHFVERDGGRCAEGWPLGARRARPLHDGAELEFCKAFEG